MQLAGGYFIFHNRPEDQLPLRTLARRTGRHFIIEEGFIVEERQGVSSDMTVAGRVAPALTMKDERRVAESQWAMVGRRLLRDRRAMIGLAVLACLAAMAILASLLTPYNYSSIDLRDRFAPPSQAHWMGTDDLGRDVLTRVLYGGRISLGVGFIVAIGNALAGSIIGTSSGYIGGRVDDVVMRTVDVMRSLPFLPILLVLGKLLGGGGLLHVSLILVVLGWSGIARIVRSVVLSLKEQGFVLAARAVGAGGFRITFKHIVPNALAPIIVAATLGAGAAIRAEAALSYLGFGIQPPTPSWGNLLMGAQEFIWIAPWLPIFPGIFIFITLLSFNFLGDGLRDALDPFLRQ